jgi:signal transduction histidine kinase
MKRQGMRGHGRTRKFRLGLVARFALASLAVFVLIAVVLSFVASKQMIRRAEASAQYHAEFVTDNMLRYALDEANLPGGMDHPITGKPYKRLDQLVTKRILESPVLRVKLWSLDGTVIFSDDPRLVGRRFPGEPDLEARRGETVSEVSDLGEAENVFERHLAKRLFSSYVPLYLNGRHGGRPDAVAEVYQDYASIQSQAASFFKTQLASFGIALFVLYVALLPIVMSAGRALRRQNEQLESQARRLEDLLAREQQTVAELRRLNKMQSDFAAVASHELRTPLTAILGYVKTLRRPEFETDPVARAEFLAAIERQGDRLFRLITNLLTAAQVEHHDGSLEVSEFDLRALAEEVAEAFHTSNGRIQFRFPETLPFLESDRVMVGEVMANLVDNALKYSSEQTPVVVEASADGTSMRILVRDSGVGVSAEQQERIFERFYQADQSATRRFGGVGLGLHLVRELIGWLGGEIDLDSRPGAGSTFTVTLPLRFPGPKRAATPPMPEPVTAGFTA